MQQQTCSKLSAPVFLSHKDVQQWYCKHMERMHT